MHIGRIFNATRVLGAPDNWEELTTAPCIGLPIREGEVAGLPAMTSAWFPTPDEIDRLISGAPVYLHIIGCIHPPVAIEVGEVPSDD
jgi:hypothetical protein